MLAQPAVVLLAVVVAAILFLLEVALPTAGLAGAGSLLAVTVAGWGIADAGADWWPLALVVAALALWGALVARHRPPGGEQLVASLLFAAGALGFAVANRDLPALLVAALASAAIPLVFPWLSHRADRLSELPAQVGMESFTGRTAVVTAWAGTAGTVSLDGSRWQARGPELLAEGDKVTVLGWDRMTLVVGARMPA